MGRGKFEARIVPQSTKFLPCKKLMWRKNLAHDRQYQESYGIANPLTILNIPNRQV